MQLRARDALLEQRPRIRIVYFPITVVGRGFRALRPTEDNRAGYKKLRIRDARRLEHAACPCYRIVKAQNMASG
ncbi:MAG: hypothetical protein C4293_08370, partial [Nitrospiraceae bacterium]